MDAPERSGTDAPEAGFAGKELNMFWVVIFAIVAALLGGVVGWA